MRVVAVVPALAVVCVCGSVTETAEAEAETDGVAGLEVDVPA